jgi:type IV pilus assembly protein PilV
MHNHLFSRYPKVQRGATLLEVLIAVLVLAVGLLGVAALQAGALRNSESSFERSQATILSYSLLDAMRADLGNARAGAYNTGGFMCAAPTTASLRDVQLADWLGALRSTTGGLGAAACGSVNCQGTTCTIVVRWDDSRGSAGLPAQTLPTVTVL